MKGHELVPCYFPWTAQSYLTEYNISLKARSALSVLVLVLSVNQAFFVKAHSLMTTKFQPYSMKIVGGVIWKQTRIRKNP